MASTRCLNTKFPCLFGVGVARCGCYINFGSIEQNQVESEIDVIKLKLVGCGGLYVCYEKLAWVYIELI